MRIAIVNDMLLAVEALRRVVAAGPGYEVAWIARDGAEAVAKCAADRPDLILMDLIMPVMDGVEATCRIMRETPCAILVVTATVEGNADKVFRAMGCGAMDAVRTPSLGPDGKVAGNELLEKIATLGRLIGASQPKSPGAAEPSGGGNREVAPLVAIGASAGGPEALATVLGKLPAEFGAAIVVVQHVNAEFAEGLAEWLNGQSKLPVALAKAGEIPMAGTVRLAAGDRHLIFTEQMHLDYRDEPLESHYRPSVDVFFRSVATFRAQPPGLGVVLTGMGRDGAAGLLELKQRRWQTVVQDRVSSVVFGMPKAAVDLGAADEILPLSQIAARFVRFAASQRVA